MIILAQILYIAVVFRRAVFVYSGHALGAVAPDL